MQRPRRGGADTRPWRFTAADNGISTKPEYTKRVFAIFQRLHHRDAYPGNGTGLAPRRKTVEFHRGTIGIERENRSGRRFALGLSEGEALRRRRPARR